MVPFFHMVNLPFPKTMQSSHLLRSGSDSIKVTDFQVYQLLGDELIWIEEGGFTVLDFMLLELVFPSSFYYMTVPIFFSSFSSVFLYSFYWFGIIRFSLQDEEVLPISC